jgi:hypothetical protein
MTYYTHTLPKFWWLNPWIHAINLHKACMAVTTSNNELQKVLENTTDMDALTIDRLASERDALKRKCDSIEASLVEVHAKLKKKKKKLKKK